MNPRPLHLLPLLLSLSLALPAQAQFVKNEWGGLILSADTDPGSSSWITLYDMEVDIFGNTIVGGQFNGTIDFDPGVDEQIEIASTGSPTGFVAKYDTEGGFLWVKSFPSGQNLSTIVRSLTTDAQGGIYIAGNPGGITDIDPGVGVTLTPANANNFIVKFNTDGDFVWGSGFYSQAEFQESHLLISPQGQLVRMGGIQNANSGTALYSISYFNAANGQSIVSYPINALGLPGAYSYFINQGYYIDSFKGTFDINGNLAVIGGFTGALDMDVLAGVSQLNAIVPQGSSSFNNFLAKYDDDMQLQWAFTLSSSNQGFVSPIPAEIRNVLTDENGNIYIGGTLQDTVDFDPSPSTFFLYPTGVSGNGDRGFVAKYSPNGDFIWAKVIDQGGIERSFMREMTLSHDGQRIFFAAEVFNPKFLNMQSSSLLMPYVSEIGSGPTEFNNIIGVMDLNGNILQANTIIKVGSNNTGFKVMLQGIQDGSVHAAFNDAGVQFSTTDPYYFGACRNNQYAHDGLDRNAIGIARYVPCTNVPVITSQPLSTQGCLGHPLTVEVEVSGATCTKKHWFKLSSNNTGWMTPVQSEELFFASFGAQDVGEYIVTVEGECGSVTSNAFTISGPVQPVLVGIGTQIFTECEGSDRELSISTLVGSSLQGDAPLSYQWKTATTVVGSTEAVTLSNLAPSDAGTYYGIVSNYCNSDTLVVQLTVTPLPDATPSALTAAFCAGEDASLSGPGESGVSYTWLDGSQNGIVNGNDFTATAGGTYYLQAQHSGCTATSAAITVTEHPLPTAPVITQNGADLSSSYATGNQWYLEGAIINGATAQTYTPTANGNYTVVHTDANTCAATSQPYNMLTVGIRGATAEGISVSPNPSSGVFTVSGTGVVQCTVHDALGREVLRTATRTIDLSTAPAGVYVLTVNTAAESTSHRLIRE